MKRKFLIFFFLFVLGGVFWGSVKWGVRKKQVFSRDNLFLSQSPFGLSGTGYWWDDYVESSMPLWKESGARWVRETAHWVFLQHDKQDLENGNFDWSLLDKQVDRFWKAGIAPVLVLGFNVEVAEDGKLRETISMPDLSPTYVYRYRDRESGLEKEMLLSYWENYVLHIVARYGANDFGLGEGYGQNKVKFWEIWNEPDKLVNRGRKKEAQIPPEDYLRLLEVSFNIIKKVDPEAKVIMGGISDDEDLEEAFFPFSSHGKISSFTQDYLHTLLDCGGCNFFDIFAIHPYRALREGALEEYVGDVQTFLKERNCDKKIWITEVGSSFYGTDSKKVAQDLERVYTSLERGDLKVERIFWYRLTPTEKTSNKASSHYYFSLTECLETRGKKCVLWRKFPAFYAYKELAWQYFWAGGSFSPSLNYSYPLPSDEFYWESGIVGEQMRRIYWGSSNTEIVGGGGYLRSSVLGENQKRHLGFYLHPYWDPKGIIKGSGEIVVDAQGKTTLAGGLIFPADKKRTDGVRVLIQIRDPSNRFVFPVLFEKEIYYDGRGDYFYIDLTPYRGEKIALVISQFASPQKDFTGNSYFDLLIWSDVEVRNQDFFLGRNKPSPQPSFTPTPMPLPTSVPRISPTPIIATPTPPIFFSPTPVPQVVCEPRCSFGKFQCRRDNATKSGGKCMINPNCPGVPDDNYQSYWRWSYCYVDFFPPF